MVVAAAAIAASETDRPLLNRLPPTQRARVLMALLALVVLGIAVAALVALGARWYRVANPPRSTGEPAESRDAWAKNPLSRETGADQDVEQSDDPYDDPDDERRDRDEPRD